MKTRGKVLHPFLLTILISWAGACSAPESSDSLAEKDPSDLVLALSSANWRQRQAAETELIKRGKEAAGAAVFQAFEQSRDARLRDRLTVILHEWGLFAVDQRTLARTLTQLERVLRDLEEQIPRIRTAEGWVEIAGEHLKADSSAAAVVLDALGDENARRFREEIVLRVSQALIFLRQEQREQTIESLAGLVRLLSEKIQDHRLLLQE